MSKKETIRAKVKDLWNKHDKKIIAGACVLVGAGLMRGVYAYRETKDPFIGGNHWDLSVFTNEHPKNKGKDLYVATRKGIPHPIKDKTDFLILSTNEKALDAISEETVKKVHEEFVSAL